MPVPGCVNVEFERHVWVNGKPSQTVDGAGFQPPGQAHAGLVVSVPMPDCVSAELDEQVWVNPMPSQTVAGAGPHVPAHVGGVTVLEQVLLVSVPTAFCTDPSHWFV